MALRFTLDVRLQEAEEPIGALGAYDDKSIRFAYAPAYARRADALPLSLSLPLRPAPYGDAAVRAFFQNLLPENNQLEATIARHGLDRDDVAALLLHHGGDCTGAVSCVPAGGPPAKSPGRLDLDYQTLGADDLDELVRRLAHNEPFPDALRDPSPVAGVQRKIALVARPDGGYALPREGSGAPTTHILKVPFRTAGREARLEEAAARLAEACGLSVSVPRAMVFGGFEALLISRFDRRVSPDGRVFRRHQEDFTQALGLPPLLKYERNGQAGRTFSAQAVSKLLDRTDAPALAKLQFLRATLFNLLIGNVDNHGKNHALIYDRGPRPRFAPLYDLQPTRLNGQFRGDFAFRIGEASRLEDLTATDLARLLIAFGFSSPAAARFVERELVPLIARLEAATLQLPRNLKHFDGLIGRETEHVVEALGLGVPIRLRDDFEAGGG